MLLRFSTCVFLILGFTDIASTQDQLGECPPYDGVITTCIFNPQTHCSSQSQCPSGYKCCQNDGCSRCTAVRVNGRHPGTCDNASGPKDRICKEDRHCKRYEKCCNRVGLGGYCRQVRRPVVPVIKY